MQSVLTRPQLTVAQPAGHLNAANAEAFNQQLQDIVTSKQSSAVLIDMELVESLDSAGLMVLVSGLTTAQQLNKRFALCSVSSSIRIIFELTQLDRVFEMVDSRNKFEAAIA